jgi:hypothetical protein
MRVIDLMCAWCGRTIPGSGICGGASAEDSYGLCRGCSSRLAELPFAFEESLDDPLPGDPTSELPPEPDPDWPAPRRRREN